MQLNVQTKACLACMEPEDMDYIFPNSCNLIVENTNTLNLIASLTTNLP
jgi:hypothetical protein